jgi:hypothetical protein
MTYQLTRMVRPWFRGEAGDHIYADCEEISGEPIEGVGWLDPEGGDVCETCLFRLSPDLYWSLYEVDE